MADNTILNPGVGGDTIATDDIAGVKHELVKVEFGGNGVATQVDAANPLPVTDNAAEVSLASIDLKISDNSQKTQIIDASGNAATITGNKLDVNAVFSGDIEIGAVELKNGTDDTRAIVTPANALKVDGSAVTQPVSGTFFQATQPVSAASLPLPSGAAIAANQQTNALTDTQLRATPVPVSGTVIVDTALLATAAKQDTGNTSLGLIKTNTDKIPTLGQALAAGSVPVVLTAAEEAILSAILTIADFDTKTGSLTETAPATDTASSGLNGRLQRIAQRLSSLIALLPTSLGAGGGLKVDGSGTALPVSGTVTATVSGSVTANAGTNLNTSLLALEAGGNLASILAKLTAAAASFVKLEDVASADGDAGTPAMAIRKATPANLSNTDGDYEFLQMSAGKLWVQAGATQKPSIGATVVMTVTNLQSLASSGTVGWQSARVSNLATLANDYEIMVKLTTANTAPSSDKAMYVYISAAYTSDAGTTWFQSSQGTTTLPTGTEGASTIASPNNLRLLGVLNYTTAQAVVQDTFLLSNCFGNRLPDGFSIIIINFSGAALSTGCIVDYSPINDILV